MLLFTLYFVVASLSIQLSSLGGSMASLWFANIMASLFLLRQPLRRWPGLLAVTGAACLAANLAAEQAATETLLLSGVNLLEVWLTARLLLSCGPLAKCLVESRRLLRAYLCSALIPPLVCGLVVGCLRDWIQGVPLLDTWILWTEGSALGVAALLPLGIVLARTSWQDDLHQLLQPGSLLLQGLTAGVTLLALLYLPYPFIYLALTLILSAHVGGFTYAAAGVLVTAVVFAAVVAVGTFSALYDTILTDLSRFYLPTLLTLIPPVFLGTNLEKVRSHMAAIRRLAEQHHRVYLHTPAMLFSMDPEGRLLSVSDTWVQHMGFERHQVTGRQAADFMTPESRERLHQQVIPLSLQQGQLHDIPLQVITGKGSVLDVLLSCAWERDDNGEPQRSLSVMDDISQQNRLAQQLDAKRELLAITLTSIADGVITTDPQGRISFLNPVAEKMTGWTQDDALGRSFESVVQLFEDDSRTPIPPPLTDGQITGLSDQAVLRSRQGAHFAVRCSISPILKEDRTRLGTVMVFQNVSESRAIAQRMAYMAHHDALTGLPNRVLFKDRLQQARELASRNQSRFAVMFLDLDHFKHINDSLGHAVGDDLLRTVARRLQRILRKTDTVCRQGGDEFLILLGQLRGDHDVQIIAQKIIYEVSLPYLLHGNDLSVTLSIGIALFPDDATDEGTLMKLADTALYRSKREGRNRFHFFSRLVDDAALARLDIETGIRQGLKNGEFHAYYQPIVDARTRKLLAFESLIRWQRSGGENWYPDQFIPVAEESGLILPLGLEMLDQATRQLALWHQYRPHLNITVNVSAVQLNHEDFVGDVQQILQENGLPATALILEFTESALMKDRQQARNILVQLHEMGVKLAIDDFGTGYASLNNLKDFPIDIVKVDKGFVQDMEEDEFDRELVRSIIRLATQLGMQVVAEGVETERQAQLLVDMECSKLQGYLFGGPASAESAKRQVTGAPEPTGHLPAHAGRMADQS